MQEIKKEEVIARVGKAVDNVVEITETLNQPEKFREMIDNFHRLSFRAERSWNKIDHALDDIQKTAKNAVSFTSKADQIIEHTFEGKGNLGQLLMGDDLYLRLKSILHKGEMVTDDIKSYGLLFHLDKRWQRLQGRRLRLLETLYNPNEFTKYFNQEMDQISSSLSRVSMVLNESEYIPQSFIMQPEFTERFAELLRRVENMEGTLKLYNEQIIEQDESGCCNSCR
jgi:phospholipid/cholesterol/gamma-HCH transport system substrate-binding protein